MSARRKPRKSVTRYRDLKPKWGITTSRTHLQRLEDAGKFPKRVFLGDNSIAWLDDEIEAYIEACAATRDLDAEAARARAMPGNAASRRAREARAQARAGPDLTRQSSGRGREPAM